MPLDQKQRSERTAERRKAAQETELRHRVRPGIKAMLADLMSWHEIDEQAEAIQLLIMNAHAAGPDGSQALLRVPRHEITISKKVARQLAEFAPAEDQE